MIFRYDVPEMSQYVDFINIMTYDFHGQWESKVGHNSPLHSLYVTSSFDKKMTTVSEQKFEFTKIDIISYTIIYDKIVG